MPLFAARKPELRCSPDEPPEDLARKKLELEIEKMIAEIEKLRADARKAEMETRIEPWKFLVAGLAAGAVLMGAATALVAAIAHPFFQT